MARRGAAPSSSPQQPVRTSARRAANCSLSSPSKSHNINIPHHSADPLNPLLPRPPSFASNLSNTLPSSAAGPSRLSKVAAVVPATPKRRKKRSSMDERDPSTAGSETGDDVTMDDSVADVERSLNGNDDANKSRIVSKGKQNICVCVRLRPSSPGSDDYDNPIWITDSEHSTIKPSSAHPTAQKRGELSTGTYDFHFDALLEQPHPTSSLYKSKLAPLVQSCLEGYTGTIFSYGQTGSGKTHTIMGSDEEPGIIPLAVRDIFSTIASEPQRVWTLKVSYLEIYLENLRDLLAPSVVGQSSQKDTPGSQKSQHTPSNDKQKTRLAVPPRADGKVFVTNLHEVPVSSIQDVHDALRAGEDYRSVAATDWNHRSSRSHCIFSITIESEPRLDSLVAKSALSSSASSDSVATECGIDSHQPAICVDTTSRRSQLHLIDLAGSEPASADEERRKEGSSINKSLHHLSSVIKALSEGRTPETYKNSKLTSILQWSLSGNARIAIICTISPEHRHGSASISTLKFAQAAKRIKTDAKKGIMQDSGIDMLQRKLAEQQRLEEAYQAERATWAQKGAELESERQRRQDAETDAEIARSAAEEHRLDNLRLKEEIARYQSNMISSASLSAASAVASPARSKYYGEVRSASAHSGPGRRRISEVAFGIPAPGPLLPSSSSMRSFSMLDTIASSGEIDAKDGEGASQAATAEYEERLKKVQATLAKALADIELAATKHASLMNERDELAERLDREETKAATAIGAAEHQKNLADEAVQQAQKQTEALQQAQKQMEIMHAAQKQMEAQHFAASEESNSLRDVLQACIDKLNAEGVSKDSKIETYAEELEHAKLTSENRLHENQALQAELDTERHKASNLLQQIEQANADVTAKAEELRQARDALASAREQLTKAEDTIRHSESTIMDHAKQNDALQQAIRTLAKEKEEIVTAQVTSTDCRLVDMQKLLDSNQETLSEQQNNHRIAITTLTAEIQDLSHKLAAAEKTLSQSSESTDRERELAERTTTALRDESLALTAQLATSRQELLASATTVKERDAALREARRSMEEMSETLKAATVTIETKSAMLANANKTIKGLESEAETLRRDKESQAAFAVSTTNHVAELETTLAATRSEVLAAHVQMQGLNKDIEQQDLARSGLESKIEKLQGQVDALKQTNEELHSRIAHLQSEADTKAQELSTQITLARAQAAQHDAVMDELAADLKRTRHKCDQAIAEKDGLLEQLRRVEASDEEMKTQNRDLVIQVRALEAARSRSAMAVQTASINVQQDFSAIRAHVRAVSSKVGLGQSSSRNLASSTGSCRSELEDEQQKKIEALQSDVQMLQTTNTQNAVIIAQYEETIRNLQADGNQMLLREKIHVLTNLLQDENSEKQSQPRTTSTPPTTPSRVRQPPIDSPDRQPLTARSTHKMPSASLLRSYSRPGTPQRLDQHHYNQREASPMPLPAHPGMLSSSPKKSTSIKRDLNKLREDSPVGRGVSIFRSPGSRHLSDLTGAKRDLTVANMHSRRDRRIATSTDVTEDPFSSRIDI